MAAAGDAWVRAGTIPKKRIPATAPAIPGLDRNTREGNGISVLL
jgi:hypothetical protein